MVVITNRKKAGFTLVEIVVTLAIIFVISTMTLLKKPAYERSLLLTNAAYDVALAIREAQVHGMNVAAAADPNSSTGTTFDAGYGVVFRSVDSTVYNDGHPADYSTFILFADLDRNGTWTSNDETIRIYKFTNNLRVYSMCIRVTEPGNNNCYASSQFSVAFRRPDPEACILWYGKVVPPYRQTSECIANAVGNTGLMPREVRISLRFPGETASRVISVNISGLITVES